VALVAAGWLGLGSGSGCDDSGSVAPAAPTTASPPTVRPTVSATTARQPRARLVYDPGGPLAGVSVAAVMKRRLEPLGITQQDLRVGDNSVVVDVPAAKVKAVRQALAGGRLDLHLFDALDPFSGVGAPQPASELKVQQEQLAGEPAVHFLVAPAAKAKELLAYLEQQSTNAKPLIGPFAAAAGDAGAAPQIRSYYVVGGESARGEDVSRAVVAAGEAVALELTLGGVGKRFLQWNSRRPTRFVALVDGRVLAAPVVTEEIKDGRLQLPLIAQSPAAAQALARQLSRGALSHRVQLNRQIPSKPRSAR